MKTISFDTLCEILKDCSAVIWGDERILTYPSFRYPEDKEDGGHGDFLHLEGTNSDFNEFEADFFRENNETIKVHGNRFFLNDMLDNEVKICPLFSKDLSEYR